MPSFPVARDEDRADARCESGCVDPRDEGTRTVQIELDPIEVDLLTYHRLLTGRPVTGEVVGGALDGYEFEVVEVISDDE